MDADEGGGTIPPAVLDDLLDSPVCRAALAHLLSRAEPVVVEDLARAVAERIDDPAVDAEAACQEFYERHLPRLTATGVVGYDSQYGTVEVVEAGDALRERLEEGGAPERR